MTKLDWSKAKCGIGYYGSRRFAPSDDDGQESIGEAGAETSDDRRQAHRDKPYEPAFEAPPRISHSALPEVRARRAARKAQVRKGRPLRRGG